MTQKEKLESVCRQFGLGGGIRSFERLRGGHINEAWRVAVFGEDKEYLAQRVNTYVFREPEAVMRNIDLVTERLAAGTDNRDGRRLLRYLKTAEGKNFLVLADGEFWRVCNYIGGSFTFDGTEGDERLLRMAGRAFGRFLRLLSGLDPSCLTETIPRFHDTEYRLREFFETVGRDELGRAKEISAETELIRRYEDFACALCRRARAGELPLRATHNDTKTDNVLFDRETYEPLAVIDLDTCMPGLAAYDFGDSIRFAACRAAEDGRAGMSLDLRRFRAYTEGYLAETAGILTEAELESLPAGAAAVTLELSSRFLADYLTGERYFRVSYPGQDLERARAQLALFEDMMRRMDDMKSITEEALAALKRDCRSDII